jgi:hypothetical protein
MPYNYAISLFTRDPDLGRHVVFCIGSIGEPSTREVLTQALSVEKDACVRAFITATLEALNNKQESGQFGSADRLKWHGRYARHYHHRAVPSLHPVES